MLEHMEAPYTHIPVSTRAIDTGVDDVGNVMYIRDWGSSFFLVFGADHAHKIKTEDEEKVMLDHYGTRQPESDCRCLRYSKMI